MNLSYPTPPNEAQRLKILEEYGILDSIPEYEYDDITKIAAQICNTPVALISLLDKNRQWFKAHTGFEMAETSRDFSFCNYTILDPEHVTMIPDLRTDERFSANPLVTGDPQVVFYAGAPLVTSEGFALGSVCVLDYQAHTLNKNQLDTLNALARQVVTLLELRKKIKELSTSQKQLKEVNKKLLNFLNVVSHDMKTPLANILLVNRTFRRKYGPSLEDNAGEFMNLIEESASELLEFIDQMLVNPKNAGDPPSQVREQTDAAV